MSAFVESMIAYRRSQERAMRDERIAKLLTPEQREAIIVLINLLPQANERTKVVFGVEYFLFAQIVGVFRDGQRIGEKVDLQLISDAGEKDEERFTGDSISESMFAEKFKSPFAKDQESRQRLFEYSRGPGIQNSHHFLANELILSGNGGVRIGFRSSQDDSVEIGLADNPATVIISGGKPYKRGSVNSAHESLNPDFVNIGFNSSSRSK